MTVRLLFAATAITFAAALALATPVQAHDCATRIQSVQDVSNPGNVQDCMRTGQTYSVAIGTVVAGAGVVIAIVGLPGRVPSPPPRPATPPQAPVQRRDPEPPQQQPHTDPCFDQQVRFATARTSARTSFATVQTLRTQRGYLESLWESTRETGYLSGVVDIAMMAGSLWTKPVAAAIGVTLAKQTALKKLGESMLKVLGKHLANDLIKHLEDQHVDFSDLLAKAGEARTKSLAMDLIKEQLTKIEFDRAAASLAGTGKVPNLAEIEKEFSGPITDVVSQTLSVVSIGSSVMKNVEKLEAIRKLISMVDDHIFAADELWQSAVNEMDLSSDSLNRCREIHGPGPK